MARKLKHETLRGETAATQVGPITLDKFGFISEKPDGVSDQEILNRVPGFHLHEVEDEPEPAKETAATSQDSKKLDPAAEKAKQDKAYADVIKELLANGAKVNSEGYIDMSVLNEALSAREMDKISGGRRKEITDEYLKEKTP